MKRKNAGMGWMLGIACAAFAALLAACMVSYADKSMQEQELALLGEQVRRAAVSCYASEGRYPQDLEYLTEHYGLVYNAEQYSVMYDAFASNIMPDIAVSVRGDDLL